MITEVGVVERINGHTAWVRTIKHSVCGSCSARAGCGQSLLNRFLGRHADICVNVPADFDSSLKEGDSIEIGIAESAVLTASLVTYGLPIVFFVLGALLAEVLKMPVVMAPVLACLGLVWGALTTRWFLRVFYDAAFFEPIALRRCPGASDIPLVQDL